MPIGEHRVRCFDCGAYFNCGDAIPERCPACECKQRGHLQIGKLCGRCGATIEQMVTDRVIDAINNPEASEPNCKGCGRPNDPYYARKYSGYCLDCSNCGMPEKDERIAELEKELLLWRPLTIEEAEHAMAQAEAVPMSEDRIKEIVEFVIDPSNRVDNFGQTAMANEIKRLRARLEAWKQVALDVREQYGKVVELLGEAGGTLAGVAENGAGNNLDQRISAEINEANTPVADVSELSACPQATATGDGHVHDGDSTCLESTKAAVVSGDQELLPSRERPCPPRDVGPNAAPR